MNIKMIAIAPDDGWAFIIKDEQLILIRPPYDKNDLVIVVEKDLENAIHKHGFQECDCAFNAIAETIDFLNQKYVEGMKRRGVPLPQKEELRGLLEFATEEILIGYLEKAELEYIPNGNLDAAEAIALALLPVEKVKKNKKVFQKTIDLITRCKEERSKQEGNKLNRLIKWDEGLSKFPQAESKYTLKALMERMGLTRQTQQLIQVGA